MGEFQPKNIEKETVTSLGEVMRLIHEGYTTIPIVEKIELREPASELYEKLRGNEPSFFVETADMQNPGSTHSFIGINPETIIRLEQNGMKVNGQAYEYSDPYAFVNDVVNARGVAPTSDLPPLATQAAGLFGYDLARRIEPTIGLGHPNTLDLPEMALIIPNISVVIDHDKNEASIVKNLVVDENITELNIAEHYYASVGALQETKATLQSPAKKPPTTRYEDLQFTSNLSQQEYEERVEIGKENCDAGEIFQIVPSRRLSSTKPVDANFANKVGKELRALNPSRHAFVFEFEDFQVAGSSPETLVRVVDGQVEHVALAGSRGRGSSPEEDAALEAELLVDEKELSEHRMLVDLGRNDLSRVCDPGSVMVPVEAIVEKHSHIMHLTSKITGTLRSDKTPLDALSSISPHGTLSGAPKIRAMQLIDELETERRGFYGGAVGHLSADGSFDSCIFIRSIVVDKNGYVHLQAGGGVVAGSVPETEYRETIQKAMAPMKAIELVCQKSQQESAVKTRRKKLGNKVVLIDNYDSYVYNLAHYLSMAGAEVDVHRNDTPLRDLIAANPDFLVVSPGPSGPEDAGVSIDAMRYFPEKGVPSLGVCLGHQALTVAFGGQVIRHMPIHGRTSMIQHDGKTVFKGLESPLQVMRYHSLIASEQLPDELEVSAFVEEDNRKITMGLRHSELPVEGVQFHPESYYTPSGLQMVRNFIQQEM